MLKYLHIENIAVIEKSDIEFKDGFNVLTGETGAGKSIVIDALNAVLGERTSKNLIRSGAQQALVNALFCNLDDNALSVLADNSYFPDEDGNIIIQRVISANGNGSIKINGQPVTSTVLKTIAPTLVNIHGQHDSQSLLNPETHYSYIDSVANNSKEIENYLSEFTHYKEINKAIKALSMDEDEKARRIDILKYQINELDSALLTAGETAELERKSALYRNFDKLMRKVNSAYAALCGGEENLSSTISKAGKQIENTGAEELDAISTRLTTAGIEIMDISSRLKEFMDSMDFDALQIEKDEKRLSFLHDLFRKYGGSEEATLLYLENAKSELEQIELSSDKIIELESELDICTENLVKYGDVLTASRKKAASVFEKSVCAVLSDLDMPYVKFVVNFEKGKYTKTGCDVIEFLISANVGEPPKPLSKIASGGELSRIMLSIKSVLTGKDEVGTLIFDEIDTGISGRAAQKVGNQLRVVSSGKQVLCVTHLAQIAARADSHFYIEKRAFDNRTYTDISLLDFEGRKREIARIIGGAITEQNLKSAEEMLNN